ncbi:N-acetylmuramoyl-L-alanine amidase-like domain-containing protein [Dissulfurispira sp.]|uniref:N-acetylmuramoyl-L-alanine amidase-like domain-containing protein n=1 Tax=Dissulfurispira sp. TaxID=2817609 RepID=UPI002FD95ABC
MESVILGRWTEERLNAIMREAAEIQGAGERIAFFSEKFLGLPYQEKTLIGDIKTPEVFVINLSAVDCFTFIDYIEAMRLSSSFSEFKENLRRVRYKTGKVAFENRNHFFTDWVESNSEFVEDVTEGIGGKNAIKVEKMLNVKEDGTYFLNGIDPKKHVVKYIPSAVIDDSIMNKLRTGDYAGIYSEVHGLDVSHVGIIIKDSERVYLRHASSVKRKVVDEDFRDYIANKPGIVILRLLSLFSSTTIAPILAVLQVWL